MSKFEVTVKKTEEYVIEIDAKNEDAAIAEAEEFIETCSDAFLYHNDSYVESIVFEI